MGFRLLIVIIVVVIIIIIIVRPKVCPVRWRGREVA